MKSINQIVAGGAIVTLLAGTVGCASWGDKQKKGTGIGAAGGGVLGAIIGHKTGSTARGAIIGAAVGGAAGALIGKRMDDQAEKLARELEGAQVSRGIPQGKLGSNLLVESLQQLQNLYPHVVQIANEKVLVQSK